MNRESWAAPTSRDEAHRRASGRRHYNSWRRFRAAYRRRQLIDVALQLRLGFFGWGAQAAIARALGVNRSTIHRDVRRIMSTCKIGQPCPVCGCEVRHLWTRDGWTEPGATEG